MKRIFLPILILLGISTFVFAQKGEPTKPAEEQTLSAEELKYIAELDSFFKVLKMESGKVTLPSKIASINVPAGHSFVPKEQAQYIISTLWGNEWNESIEGLILKSKEDITDPNSIAWVISYAAEGHVEDNDAEDTDYGDVLKSIQEAEKDQPAGGRQLSTLGWAEDPHYDKAKHVFYWGVRLKVAGGESVTLNYNLRYLSRRGMLVVNAVTDEKNLSTVKSLLPTMVNSVVFENGERYEDFDSKTDNVAAYTVGALVAGKVLAKVGFFAIIAKFGKLIIVGIIGAFAGLRKFFRRKRDEEEEEETTPEVAPAAPETVTAIAPAVEEITSAASTEEAAKTEEALTNEEAFSNLESKKKFETRIIESDQKKTEINNKPTTNTKNEFRGITPNVSFEFEKISTINIPDKDSVFILPDGTEFFPIAGIFAGMREINVAKIKKNNNDDSFAVLEKKNVGVVYISDKTFKLSSSNCDLKIGDCYTFQIRTSKKIKKKLPNGMQIVEFEFQNKYGQPVRWLVMDSELYSYFKY